jgi:DNA-binding transcriptional ArsR family regulator
MKSFCAAALALVCRFLTCKYLLAYSAPHANLTRLESSLAPETTTSESTTGIEGTSTIDKVFKALADPTRRRLLDLLHEDNGQTLTALCEHMAMTRQAVTQHLQLLEEANLVVIVWQGREKLHYLNPVPLHEIAERWIGKFERSRLSALRDLKKKLEGD